MKRSNSLSSHLLSILALPFMVTAIAPWLIHTFIKTKWFSFFHFIDNILSNFISGFVMSIGFLLFLWTMVLFAKVGKGTLAPWAPPEKFVVVGPYKYVRNPMICAVNLFLIGIAFLLKNENIIIWQIIFMIINTIYFIKKEEPDLENRFGVDYVLYKKHVGRWLPRIKGWKQS